MTAGERRSVSGGAVPGGNGAPASSGAVGAWWLGIRPKTLSAAIAPVLVGTALAAHDGAFHPMAALAALAGAMLIQIGTNLSNDVLDYRRGADHGDRLGPVRVTQAGILAPRTVAAGAAVSFGLAAAAGLYLIAVAGTPILVLGAAAIVSGVLYTAGPYPLAYVGLGDAFVMVFFGLAAVVGTYYVQALDATVPAWVLGVAVGALSVAILNVNNLRDVATDAAAGKRTLAVRLGERSTRLWYALNVVLALVVPCLLVLTGRLGPAVLLVLLVLPAAVGPVRCVLAGEKGRGLNAILGATARLQMLHAAALVVGLLLDGAARAG